MLLETFLFYNLFLNKTITDKVNEFSFFKKNFVSRNVGLFCVESFYCDGKATNTQTSLTDLQIFGYIYLKGLQTLHIRQSWSGSDPLGSTLAKLTSRLIRRCRVWHLKGVVRNIGSEITGSGHNTSKLTKTKRKKHRENWNIHETLSCFTQTFIKYFMFLFI